MKELRSIPTLATAVSLAVLVSQPASANPTQVTNVRLNPNGTGVDLVLETQGSKAPQVFNVNRGNTWNAYVFNAQIRAPFRQDNPAPGISLISVVPVAGNGVQVTVVGKDGTPIGQVASRNAQGVIFNVGSAGGAVPVTSEAAPMKAMSATTVAQSAPSAPLPTSRVPVAPFVPTAQVPTQGQPTVPVAPVPPLLRRAVAPPVGDQAVSQIDTSPTAIDLGSNERIPRLVLRDAPVREVLSLLARAAGLNLAYTDPSSGQQQGQQPGAKSSGPTISLDIENESVQDVFNYVLRVTCVTPTLAVTNTGGFTQCSTLEANRVGRTLFVGPRLPDDARNSISRTIRLNQVSVSDATGFLTSQGAESQVPIEQVKIQTVGEGAAARTIETRTPTIIPLRADDGNAPLVLRGLSVSSNTRLNSITITGSPKKVEIATRFLAQLDARKRQVALNVKIVDINLIALKRIGTSFSFGVGNSQFTTTGGVALFNFGGSTPNQAFLTQSAPLTPTNELGLGSSPTLPFAGFPINLAKNFLAQLQAAVTEGNAKLLTDPTLVVQEGQNAKVDLTQEVVTNITQSVTFGQGTSQATITVEKKPVGLTLPIAVDRIDDNGFITLAVAPEVSQPSGAVGIQLPNGPTNTITLIAQRKLQSGQIRLRDGQTLVLAGIIQEQDRVTATKVPILGDLPLLGSLFRRTENARERREVIVILTPQIIEDGDNASYGYGYTPGKEVRQFLQQQGNR